MHLFVASLTSNRGKDDLLNVAGWKSIHGVANATGIGIMKTNLRRFVVECNMKQVMTSSITRWTTNCSTLAL